MYYCISNSKIGSVVQITPPIPNALKFGISQDQFILVTQCILLAPSCKQTLSHI